MDRRQGNLQETVVQRVYEMIHLLQFGFKVLQKFFFLTPSFSQEGEDIVIDRLLNYPPNGFYVDIGAHHPMRFSNTFKFYLRGWSGINVEPRPGSKIKFEKLRPRDLTFEIGISKVEGELTFYEFDEPALNTFSKDLAQERVSTTTYKIIGKQTIATMPLTKFFERNIEKDQTIDLLSVDVEGLDLEVLESNDWKTYRPRLIVCEILNTDLSKVEDSEIFKFLKQQNYVLVAKTVNSVFFKEVY